MKFHKGQKAQVQAGDGWLDCEVTFVWRGIDLESKQRVFQYDVSGKTDSGLPWDLSKVPETMVRKRNRARGRRRVLRAHSIRPEKLT